jgi:DNA-binding transcriptional LysR family regulator
MANTDHFLRSQLKTRHLQLLVALDDFRHLGRVAECLHVTQPAVSLALGELEKGLGVKLFERTPKGVTPNAYGECVIGHARLMTAQLAQLRESLQALKSGSDGRVHVGALPAMTPGLLPVAMAAFKAQMPKASVTVQEGLMETLLPELRRGMLDVVVGRLLSPNKPDDLDEEPLYDGTNVLVVKAGHPLAHTNAPTWTDLVRHPWVLPPVGSLSRAPLENVLQQHGCALPVDGIETLSIPLIAQYLQLRDAVGIMSWVVAQHYINTGVLVRLPLDLPNPQRPIGITWNRHRPMTPVTRGFVQCLRDLARHTDLENAPAT